MKSARYPRKADIERVVTAIRASGVDVGEVEVAPDGTIKVIDARSFRQPRKRIRSMGSFGSIMIKGVHFVRVRKPDKPIRWYIYAWRGGPQIQTTELPNKPKLSSEALARLAQALQTETGHGPGTLADIIRRWSLSPEWKYSLSENSENLGDQPRKFDRGQVGANSYVPLVRSADGSKSGAMA